MNFSPSKLVLILLLFFLSIGFGGQKLSSQTGLVFQESWNDDISGAYLASRSGEVLVHSEKWVALYNPSGKQAWRKDGFNFVTGAGISEDGRVIIYQTSLVPKTNQLTSLDLTVHILDGQGNELLSKPNPYRYFITRLSPKGNYIIFGESMAKEIYVYDRFLNSLWKRETYIWYVGFDPDEEFIYDSTSGMLLNLEGRKVWDLVGGQKFLGISSRAEIILSQPFLTVGSGRNQLYLTNRVSLEQVILEGYCAGVSYDGSLVAYQDLGEMVLVYRTRELLEKGRGGNSAPALWKGKFVRAKLLQFSRDDETLFIYGESGHSGRANLIELRSGKKQWEKVWSHTLHKYLLSDDNRFLMVQTNPRKIEYYRLR